MPQQLTRLDLDGRATQAAIDRVAAKAENAIEAEILAEQGGDARATIEYRHERGRWSAAAYGQWSRVRGWATGARAKWRL